MPDYIRDCKLSWARELSCCRKQLSPVWFHWSVAVIPCSREPFPQGQSHNLTPPGAPGSSGSSHARTKEMLCQVQFTPALAVRNVLQVHLGAVGVWRVKSLWELWGQLLTFAVGYRRLCSLHTPVPHGLAGAEGEGYADAAIPALKTRTSSLQSCSRKLNTAWKCGLGELGPPGPHIPDLLCLHRKGFWR